MASALRFQGFLVRAESPVPRGGSLVTLGLSANPSKVSLPWLASEATSGLRSWLGMFSDQCSW